MPQLQSIPPAEWKGAHDFIDLYSVCTTSDFPRLTALLASWLEQGLPSEKERSLVHGQQWITFIEAMYGAYEKHEGKEAARKAFGEISVPAGNEFLVGVAYAINASRMDVAMFNGGGGKRGVATAPLEAQLAEAPEVFFHAWPQLRHLSDEAAANGFVEALATHLKATDATDDHAKFRYLVQSFNMVFEEARTKPAIIQQRKTLLNSGVLYHAIKALEEATDDDSVHARAAALYAVADHFREGPIQAGLSPAG